MNWNGAIALIRELVASRVVVAPETGIHAVNR